MLSHLEKRVFNIANHNPSALLTIHEHPHILDESVDNGERMSCSSPGLVLRQSVKPLEDCPDVLLFEKFLYEFDCVLLGKVKRRRERTHLNVAV